MALNIKPLSDSDYDNILCGWWKDWKWTAPAKDFLPSTGEMFGITNLYNPETNIKAGIKFLVYLDSHWKESITDSLERIKFVLAGRL